MDSNNSKTPEQKNRKKAQKYLLFEHVCNTLADRMWLFAAGMLLMEAISRINPEISQITISALYGLILSAVKVTLSPKIGSIVEKTSRLKGALVPLFVQNLSVAISAGFLTAILYFEDWKVDPWLAFSIVTFFSCTACLASVGLMNAVSRDWAVEISSEDELTYLNAWLCSINQASLVLSAGLSGFLLAYNQAIGAIIVATINILAMIFQAYFLYKIYYLVPSLARKSVEADEGCVECAGFKEKISEFFDGWILLAKSKVFIPGLALACLYINQLGMSMPMQGYARESCLSESTISVIYIISAVIGFVAPVCYPFLIKIFGFVGTGLSGCFCQLIFIFLSVVALFIPGSPYILYQENLECPVSDQSDLLDQNETDSNFWIRCPEGIEPPSSYASITLIFISVVSQRWGLYIFDIVTMQFFQMDTDESERNRVSAGQYSLESIFSVLMNGLALIWNTSCDFGSAILIGNIVILIGYSLYIVWSCSSVSILTKDGRNLQVPRVRAYKFNQIEDEKSGDKVNKEITEL